MANLVSVERASLALGTAQVLDEVSLGLLGGDRVGVVGRNGGIVWEKGYGSMDWGFGLPTVDARNTMYDLASITKVVGTSAARRTPTST